MVMVMDDELLLVDSHKELMLYQALADNVVLLASSQTKIPNLVSLQRLVKIK